MNRSGKVYRLLERLVGPSQIYGGWFVGVRVRNANNILELDTGASVQGFESKVEQLRAGMVKQRRIVRSLPK